MRTLLSYNGLKIEGVIKLNKLETVEDFNEVINENRLSVVKFHTTWCPDCRRLDIFIPEIISEHNDKAWYEIDKDAFPELADKYDVMGIPSLLVYHSGKKIAHLHSANAKTANQVREFLSIIKY
jgi:thiol-disulfide isomerase/thioredoxin